MLSHQIARTPLKKIQLNCRKRSTVNLVHLSSGPGGIELLLPVIVKNIQDRSFAAFVIRTNHDANGVYEGVHIPVKYGSNRNAVAYLKVLWHTLRNREAVFHVFNIGPVFLLLMKLGGARKIIYSIHGTIYWRTRIQKLIYGFLWPIALSHRTILLANSEHSRNEFLRQIDCRAHVRLLYNPIDSSRFCPDGPGLNKREILVIYSGRLEKGKNLQKWIEIASYVHAAMPSTRFEIYGQGSLAEMLQRQIASQHAEDYIALKGFRKDIEKIYRMADVFMFLSEYESFGNVVVESILCCTPVIVSPIPVMKEIFQDHPQFVLNEKEDFKEQVLSKLRQLGELKKLTGCAREKFVKRFSVNQHIESLRNIYDGFE